VRLLPLTLLAVNACVPTCGDAPALPTPDAAPRPATRPPPRDVRYYPPHAIRSDGIGPYKVGAPLIDVLDTLPEGPRLSVLQLGEYANWQLVRAEGGELHIGIRADTRTVGFIAVLSQPIAHTADGLGVGSTGSDLVKALGTPEVDSHRVSDRWSFAFAKLPGVRFLSDAGHDEPAETARIVAVLVGETAERPRAAPPCRTAGELTEARDEVLTFVGSETAKLRFGCVSGKEPEVIAWSANQLQLIGGGPGKLRRVGATPSPEPVLLGALDVDEDGRDEIVAGFRVLGAEELAIELRVWRWGAAGLEPVLDARPFVITRAMALAVGSPLPQVDLVIDVAARGGEVWVSGFYLARTLSGRAGAVRDLVPLREDRFALVRRPAPPGSVPAPPAVAVPDAATDHVLDP
jgi:hypothetical protein